MAWQELKWLLPLIAVVLLEYVPWGLLFRLSKEETEKPWKDVV
jgi:hypothetical protein